MKALELLNHLRDLDVKFYIEDEQLCYSAPKGVLTPQLRAELADRRVELIQILHEMNWAENHGASLRAEEHLLQELDATASLLLQLAGHGSNHRRALFFIHPIGGTVFCYIDLARYLGPRQTLYGLQARGLEGEQEPHTCVEEMATDYIRSIRRVQPRGPYLLGGWSMGGVVAFEMAQQLAELGEQVELLALVDSFAPAAKPASELSDTRLLERFVLSMGLRFDHDVFEQTSRGHSSCDQVLRHVINRATRDQMPVPELDPVQIGRLFRVFRSNVVALSQYLPHTYTEPINVFRASDQSNRSFTEDMGWKPFASGHITINVIPGDHYTIIREPNVRCLAEKLSALCHSVMGL